MATDSTSGSRASGRPSSSTSELFGGIYFCRTEEPRFFAWAEPFASSPTVERFARLSAELDVAIEELSVTGEELREQTDELTATRRALEAERQRYQELFEAAPVAYLVTDPMARIREANRAAAVQFGSSGSS